VGFIYVCARNVLQFTAACEARSYEAKAHPSVCWQ